MIFNKKAAFCLLTAATAASTVSATHCPEEPEFKFEKCVYTDKSGNTVDLDLTTADEDGKIPKDACYIECTGNYGKELMEDNGWQQKEGGEGISLVKFSANNEDFNDNGTKDVWNPAGKTWTWGKPDSCLELECGAQVHVEAIMNNRQNDGRGQVCDPLSWEVECPEECPPEPASIYCVEAVNPSGKHIPTAGWSLNPKVSPHQNPDGFYTFGYLDSCGNPICEDANGDLLEIHLWSGLQDEFDSKDLDEFDETIKNLKSEKLNGPRDPHYASCDVVKYTQFANDKGNREKKIGSPAENVRAHLQGSGDMVVSSDKDFAMYAECRVPKPPARFLRG